MATERRRVSALTSLAYITKTVATVTAPRERDREMHEKGVLEGERAIERQGEEKVKRK